MNALDIILVFFFFQDQETCLAWKNLSLAGSVHLWFINLHVPAVLPVTWAKRSGIFPHVCESIYPLISPITFSYICRILNRVVPYVQQFVSMLWITPPVISNLKYKRCLTFLEARNQALNLHFIETSWYSSWFFNILLMPRNQYRSVCIEFETKYTVFFFFIVLNLNRRFPHLRYRFVLLWIACQSYR